MPIYEYECPQCGKKRFKQKPFDLSDELETCNCGVTMNKILGGSFIVKGFSEKNGYSAPDEGDYMTGKTIDIEV